MRNVAYFLACLAITLPLNASTEDELENFQKIEDAVSVVANGTECSISDGIYADFHIFYVNGICGNDLWTGERLRCLGPDGPKRTIQAAIDAAPDKSIIIVLPATYFENIVIENRKIIIAGIFPEKTIIDGGGIGRVMTIINSHVGILGVTVQNGNGFPFLGGGVYSKNSSFAMVNCIVKQNNAGGMYIQGGTPVIIKCTIRNNSTNSDGGGVFIQGGTPVIINCIIENNRGIFGGGIEVQADTCLIKECVVRNNSADELGGGIDNSGTLLIQDCIITANGSADGGGIANTLGGSVQVWNSLITDNRASLGAALYNLRETITAVNCTFAGNFGFTSLFLGTGIDCINCIIWDNTPSDIGALSVRYSCIQDFTGGGIGNISDDPMFVNPGVNYRLLPGSPCIDAGDNTAVPSGITTDLDGNPRFIDDPRTIDTGRGNPPIVDMGAYEFLAKCGDYAHPYPPADLNHDCIVDFADLAIFCQHWLECTKPECAVY